jgi:hypothetical protein
MTAAESRSPGIAGQDGPIGDPAMCYHLTLLANLNPFSRLHAAQPKAQVETADDVMQLLGAAAFGQPTQLSWHEEGGLVHSPQPSYWWNVRHDIDRGVGRRQAAFTASW